MAKLVNELAWSVSRAQLFETCRRAYFYNYYGSWAGWEEDAPPKVRQLYVLKNICTMEMWAGSIVHSVIAEALKRFPHDRRPVRTGELQARAREILRQGWLDSVNRQWLLKPKKTNLYELYYGDGRSLPKEQTDRIRDRVYNALAAFADSAILKEILSSHYLAWKPVDKLDSFALDGMKVWCAVDFAYTDPNGVLHIIDWKTGAEKPDALRMQLACYVFYAQERWHAQPEHIRPQGVFLAEGGARSQVYDISAQDLLEAKDRILTTSIAMRGILRDADNNVAAEEDFDCCGNQRVCHKCCFGEVCPQVLRESALARQIQTTHVQAQQ